ncbi:MAG TPA: hypothetical protein VHD63_13750 [Ktedonobacteraceae bacterium]|nr:hypothetical protein [Ktedonobacteraceae bacterium]
MRKDLLIKLNSFLAVCLAILFFCFFQFTKHDPVLAAILPFANDPYDAVGSFGVILAVLVSLLAVLRALRRKRTTQQNILLARTQLTVAAAVLVTLVTDSVATLRHIPMWINHAGAAELIMLMGGMIVLALGLSLAIRFSIRDIPLAVTGAWKKAAVFSLVAIVLLAFYPESVIQSTLGELCTLLVGILLLFVPLSALPEAFIPFNTTPSATGNPQPRRMRPWMQWGAIVMLGLCVGSVLLLGEWSGEGGSPPFPLKIVIASIFIGASIVGLLIAYVCLRKPLALFRYA